ncbi:MAG: DsrE family protein [Acidobacteriota bacterium]|nr:DsrE family protein [Acidobacteriota bacterium]
MKVLIVLNDPPYGTERSYNGLRLAGALSKREDVEVRVFLFGDAVGCALANQKLPDGYYHLDRMVSAVIRRGGEVGCCGTCMDARAFAEDALVEGARRSTLEEVSEWTIWADKALSF